jgi:undecaprenyl diphosphate synthase
MSDKTLIPRHVGIIMDGNGRWANARGLERSAGHRAGLENARDLVPYVFEQGVEVLTVFAFSTENWSRGQEEIGLLFDLFREAMEDAFPKLIEENIRIRFIGDRDSLRGNYSLLVEMMEDLEKRSVSNTGGIFVPAINYGGQDEIIRATKRLWQMAFSTNTFSQYVVGDWPVEFGEFLDTRGIPDVDLVIRTAGEERISNFLLFQAAYAEFYTSEKTWPEFGREDFDEALEEYGRRTRKFGAVI